MATSRLSSKGQIVIPKAVRVRRHWEAGTELVFEEVPEGVLLRPGRLFPPTRLEDGLGCAGYEGPARSLEEIAAAVNEAFRAGREGAARP